MNRGSLPIGKILLIAAIVIALFIFVRPFISGTGSDKDATLSTNQEQTHDATEAAPHVNTEMAPADATPSDSAAPQATNPEAMAPAAPTQEPAAVEPTTPPSAN